MKVLTKDYVFHWAEETAWAITLGVIAVVGPMVMALDTDTVGAYGAEEWKTWGIAAAVAASRVVGALLLNSIRTLFAKE